MSKCKNIYYWGDQEKALVNKNDINFYVLLPLKQEMARDDCWISDLQKKQEKRICFVTIFAEEDHYGPWILKKV